MLKFLTCTFILIGCYATAQLDEAKRVTEQLCSPSFHGRGYVANGDRIAAEYLAKEFEKINVQPYKGESYFQSFSLNGINRFPSKMQIIQGQDTLTPGIHFMVDPSSNGYTGEIVPAELDPSDLFYNDSVAIDMQKLNDFLKQAYAGGKNGIVLRTAHLKGDSLMATAGLSEALANYHPVIEVVDKKFTWSVGRDQLKHPLVYIQDSVFNENEKYELTIDAEFVKTYPSQNVIAYIPAKKKCAKTIVFTAHYDHLGQMGEATYFPGANDNASGTAMLITMAKYFKEQPSEYNIMFIAFAGEEAGLVGSKYYSEHPIQKLKKIKFLINLDIMGSGEEGITAVNATLFPKEFELLQKVNAEQSLLAQVKSRGPAANSDHYWFTLKGVPAFFIYTMGPNKNYHDVFDKAEELSWNEFEDITTLLVSFIEQL